MTRSGSIIRKVSPAVAAGDERFQSFIADCVDVLNSTANLELRQERIADLTNVLAAEWTMPDKRFLQLQPDAEYSSFLLYLHPDQSLCVVLDIFMPGQAAWIHNHLCWCIFVCLEGAEIESKYSVPVDLSSGPVLKDTARCPEGRVRVAPADKNAFHQVECPSDIPDPAVSLHVYGADIGRLIRDTWDESEGNFRKFKSGYTNDVLGLPHYYEVAQD